MNLTEKTYDVYDPNGIGFALTKDDSSQNEVLHFEKGSSHGSKRSIMNSYISKDARIHSNSDRRAIEHKKTVHFGYLPKNKKNWDNSHIYLLQGRETPSIADREAAMRDADLEKALTDKVHVQADGEEKCFMHPNSRSKPNKLKKNQPSDTKGGCFAKLKKKLGKDRPEKTLDASGFDFGFESDDKKNSQEDACIFRETDLDQSVWGEALSSPNNEPVSELNQYLESRSGAKETDRSRGGEKPIRNSSRPTETEKFLQPRNAPTPPVSARSTELPAKAKTPAVADEYAKSEARPGRRVPNKLRKEHRPEKSEKPAWFALFDRGKRKKPDRKPIIILLPGHLEPDEVPSLNGFEPRDVRKKSLSVIKEHPDKNENILDIPVGFSFQESPLKPSDQMLMPELDRVISEIALDYLGVMEDLTGDEDRVTVDYRSSVLKEAAIGRAEMSHGNTPVLPQLWQPYGKEECSIPDAATSEKPCAAGTENGSGIFNGTLPGKVPPDDLETRPRKEQRVLDTGAWWNSSSVGHAEFGSGADQTNQLERSELVWEKYYQSYSEYEDASVPPSKNPSVDQLSQYPERGNVGLAPQVMTTHAGRSQDLQDALQPLGQEDFATPEMTSGSTDYDSVRMSFSSISIAPSQYDAFLFDQLSNAESNSDEFQGREIENYHVPWTSDLLDQQSNAESNSGEFQGREIENYYVPWPSDSFRRGNEESGSRRKQRNVPPRPLPPFSMRVAQDFPEDRTLRTEGSQKNGPSPAKEATSPERQPSQSFNEVNPEMRWQSSARPQSPSYFNSTSKWNFIKGWFRRTLSRAESRSPSDSPLERSRSFKSNRSLPQSILRISKRWVRAHRRNKTI